MFVLAPLAALAIGHRRLALEAAGFAAIAAIGSAVLAPAAAQGDVSIAAHVWTLAALAQVCAFLWAASDDTASRGLSDSHASTSIDPNALQEALRERTAFFAGLGHDLKTPLNAIIGFSDLMKSQLRGPLPEAYRDYAGLISESGQDLLLLVEDMLDLAKSEAGRQRIDPEPVDLSASGASVARQLEVQAVRRNVILNTDGLNEVWAEADPRAVRQIWQNLGSNAVKYAKEGGEVRFAAYMSGGQAVLSVSDDGIGMEAADLDRIAAPFAQGGNARGRAGVGLGLAVVRRFAELHGGQLIIDTAPGAGTRVEVVLPAADPDTFADFEEAAQ